MDYFDGKPCSSCCAPNTGGAMITTFNTQVLVQTYYVPAIEGHHVIRLSKGQQIMDPTMYSVAGGNVTFNVQIDDIYYCVIDYVY